MAALESEVPVCRRWILRGLREGSERQWGREGLTRIGARLPDDVRKRTIDSLVLTEPWFPETDVLAWYAAILDGPAEGDEKQLLAVVRYMIDTGFGVIQRFLLGMIVSPKETRFVGRIPATWHQDHSTGRIEIARVGDDFFEFVLHDHIYAESGVAVRCITECFRHGTSLTKIPHRRAVTATHERIGPRSLRMTVRWGPGAAR